MTVDSEGRARLIPIFLFLFLSFRTLSGPGQAVDSFYLTLVWEVKGPYLASCQGKLLAARLCWQGESVNL